MTDSESKAIWMALGDMEKSVTLIAIRLDEQAKKIEALSNKNEALYSKIVNKPSSFGSF